jgi:NAD-dependent deacetylase
VSPAVDSYAERLERGAMLLQEASTVVAFTGAGISTESGISDFRSPGGVWARHRTVTYQEFVADPAARREYWKMKQELHRELDRARPNRAHLALAGLEKAGKLSCLITQNIDGLHLDAGNSPDKVVEIHGTNRRALCLDCGGTWPIGEIQKRLESGEEDPRCEDCGGMVKPATVMFGQAMPEEEISRAFECAGRCDLFLMIGSSLQVEPAASIPRAARQAGARLIYVNRTATPSDSLAELLFREPAGETLGRMVDRYHELA